jgi:hypothetical protein
MTGVADLGVQFPFLDYKAERLPCHKGVDIRSELGKVASGTPKLQSRSLKGGHGRTSEGDLALLNEEMSKVRPPQVRLPSGFLLERGNTRLALVWGVVWEVANSAVDPAADKRTPDVVASARRVGFLLSGQDLLLNSDDFIHARGQIEGLSTPRLILSQQLCSCGRGRRSPQRLLRT